MENDNLAELKPCRECGAPCSIQNFEGSWGKATIWVCGKHMWLGGDCPSTTAYLTQDAWNLRPTPTPDVVEADEETYQIGLRDGYEKAVQELDEATGGDGVFFGSTFPGETVDERVMKQRIIDRFAALAASQPAPDVAALDLEDLLEALDRGVPRVGFTEDNSIELFDIEAANEAMFDAAAAFRKLGRQP